MKRGVFSGRARILVTAVVIVTLAGCAASTHHRAGMSAMERESYVEAVNELKQAAELAPRDVQYQQDWLNNREVAINRLLAMASNATTQSRLEEAESLYRTVLKFDPNNARALAGLEYISGSSRAAIDAAQAREALKRGDTAVALKWAERALNRIPTQPDAMEVKREAEALQSKELIGSPNLSNLYRKPINLEFRDASVKMVFDALSRTTGINFIFDRDVRAEQRTTVNLKQTTLEDAIDMILTTNQLEKKLLNSTSVLIYPSTPAKLKEYQDLVVKAFYLSNVDAKTAANLLKTVLKIKDVYVDEKYHLVVLRENPDTISLAEKLIALQDLEEPEVMLEVEVLEINRNSLLNLGIQFTNQFTIAPLSTLTSPGAGSGPAVANPTIKLGDWSRLNSNSLGITSPTATITLQKSDGNANLLANPRLRVRDKEKAKILIGDKVPVVTTTTTPNGFLSESIQYLDVGLKLEVEPEIHLRDEIALKLGLEVSTLVGVVKTASGSQAYQIGTRNISSALRLRDGETQILAGLISDADRSDANRVPLLGDVPVLGRLFSSQKDDRQKTEIVMSITPHLVRNIQRRSPTAESFWSGTETSLRTRPVQIRNGSEAAAPVTLMPGDAAKSLGNTGVQMAASDTSGLRLTWAGAKQVRVGQTATLDLVLDSSHQLRAAPFQLAFDPTRLEILSVMEGNVFSQAGKNTFSHVVDKPSGRASVGIATAEAAGAKGSGKLATVEFRSLAPGPTDISVIGMTPVGATQALAKPSLPVTQRITAEP